MSWGAKLARRPQGDAGLAGRLTGPMSHQPPPPNRTDQDGVAHAAAVIASSPTLALACHVTPDGDALGSMLAMHHLALAAGKQVVSSWPEPFVSAACYRSIPGLDLAVPSSRFPYEPDVMVTFDCGSVGRLKELAEPASRAVATGQLIVLDHHATNERFGTINVVDTSAAATAVVVREVARAAGWPLNRDAATCLYVGLTTDTGHFQYSSTTPQVFALAEELAEFDVPIARLSRELFGEHRFAYLQLASVALARAELDEELGLVLTSVTLADLASHNVAYEEVEGLIEWVRSAAEAEIACVLKEAPDGFRVSLRSVSRVDVGAIAQSLGGGGHRLAAGFTMDATREEIVAIVKARLRAHRVD